jgi:Phage integrase, N-terminal SAM-like domain
VPRIGIGGKPPGSAPPRTVTAAIPDKPAGLGRQRVKNFAAFLGRSPDTASFEDVRRYQLHLTVSGIGVPTVNQTVSTLRFFFKVTLGSTYGRAP